MEAIATIATLVGLVITIVTCLRQFLSSLEKMRSRARAMGRMAGEATKHALRKRQEPDKLRFAKLLITGLGLVFRQKDVDEWQGDLLEGYECQREKRSAWYCRIWLLKEVTWLVWPMMKPAIKKVFPWLFGGGAAWMVIRSINPFAKNKADD